MAKRTVLNVTDGDSNQIAGNRDIARKTRLVVRIVLSNDSSLIGAHLCNEFLLGRDLGIVGDPVGRSILEWSDGAAVDILTLSEHVRKNTTGGLVSIEP